MKRVADISVTSICGGYSGAIIGALILTVLNSVLTLLDVPESVRETSGSPGAFELADFCA